jgi:hypothetical protein
MTEIDERTAANMDVALESVCKGWPNGGDHESRKHIAEQLIQSAMEGNTTLGGLTVIARRALRDLPKRKSA